MRQSSTPEPDPRPEAADAELLRFLDVSVCYDEVAALEHIDLTLPADGVTAVVGPSGSGKSTLLRLCNRLEVPTHGRVVYRGRPLDELDPRALRREVGMVFQQAVVFDGSVRDNLEVAAAAPGTRADAAALRAMLERVALDPALLARDARTLSGGEAQRVCLARTLLTDPQVLLLDEPTAALDEAPKRAFEATVGDVLADGTSVVWVTHELAQVRRVADRVVLLERGRVMLDLDDVDALDEHPEVARLFDPEGADGRG